MKRLNISFLLVVLVCMTGIQASAHDIEVANSDGSSVFQGCSNLTSVTMEMETPVSIVSNTFSNRTNATLYVPQGSKAAYEEAPYWNEFMEIVEMDAPAGSNIVFADANVKALCIANWDTNNDRELSYAEAAAVTDLGTVFKNNEDITSFDELQFFTGLTNFANTAFYKCTGLASVIIPNSVTTIGDYVFDTCVSLTNIEIPNSVTSIGYCMLGGCTALTSINVATGNTNYDSRNNCNAIIETVSNTIIAGCKNTVILNSVTCIGNAAFAGIGLTSIDIPNSVTSIGNAAFYGCI